MSLHFLPQLAATRLNLVRCCDVSLQENLCRKSSQFHRDDDDGHRVRKLFASVLERSFRQRSGTPANASGDSSRSCTTKSEEEEEEKEDGVVGRTQQEEKKKLSCSYYAGDGWCEEETQGQQQQDVKAFAQDDDDDDDDGWDVLVEDEDVQLLAKFRTMYNYVQVLEVARRAEHPLAGARILLLDKPGNIQSVYFPQKVLTDSYYDVFATLPPLLPDGPVGILGLGAGTAARILQHFWPAIDLHGWELDPAVIMVARQFFNLSELEEGGKPLARSCRFASEEDKYASIFAGSEMNEEEEEGASIHRHSKSENANMVTRACNKGGLTSGKLHVHIGDALNLRNITIPGGFAGVIVDLFAGGAVIPALQQIETWQQLGAKLSPGGRIMVNCGGSCVEAEGQNVRDGRITMEQTLMAMAMAFPGNKVCRKNLGGTGNNTLALTGPTPDLHVWKQALPECLREGATGWAPVFPTADDH